MKLANQRIVDVEEMADNIVDDFSELKQRSDKLNIDPGSEDQETNHDTENDLSYPGDL